MVARIHVRIKLSGQFTHVFLKDHASQRPPEGTAAPSTRTVCMQPVPPSPTSNVRMARVEARRAAPRPPRRDEHPDARAALRADVPHARRRRRQPHAAAPHAALPYPRRHRRCPATSVVIPARRARHAVARVARAPKRNANVVAIGAGVPRQAGARGHGRPPPLGRGGGRCDAGSGDRADGALTTYLVHRCRGRHRQCHRYRSDHPPTPPPHPPPPLHQRHRQRDHHPPPPPAPPTVAVDHARRNSGGEVAPDRERGSRCTTLCVSRDRRQARGETPRWSGQATSTGAGHNRDASELAGK